MDLLQQQHEMSSLFQDYDSLFNQFTSDLLFDRPSELDDDCFDEFFDQQLPSFLPPQLHRFTPSLSGPRSAVWRGYYSCHNL